MKTVARTTPGLTTGPPEHTRRALLGGALGGALGAVLGGAGGRALAQATPRFDLAVLMGQLAQRKSGDARFTEERTVSGLDDTLRASGRLSFQAPDRFARYTEEPRPESMEVEGNQVVLKRGSRTRQMALDAVPELAALADAMRGTLNGDALALQRHFKTRVGGNTARWVLLLTPLDARLARSVQQLEIAGTGSEVRSIDLLLAGGDRSLMLISPIVTPATPVAPVAPVMPVTPAPAAPARK